MKNKRQAEVQALAEPTIEQAIGQLANMGLDSAEIAQALILTGAGLLAGAMGPKGAGHDLRTVAEMIPAWINRIGDTIERKNH